MADESSATAERPSSRWHTAVALGALALFGWGYVASVQGVWAVHSDSACYLGLARSLARGQGYQFNHALFSKYPPVFPFLLSLVYRAVGEDFRALQMVVVLGSVGALGAAYALVRARAGHWAALAVMVLAGSCTWSWTYTSICMLPQMVYACFSIAALAAAEWALRSRELVVWQWLVALVLMLAGIFSHMSGAALVPAICMAALCARGLKWPVRQRLILALVLGIVCTGTTLFWIKRGWAAGMGSGYTNLMSHEPMDMLANPFPKLKLRASEWTATPLGFRSEAFPWPLGAALLATLLLPGLVRGFRRHRSCTEWYVCSYYAVMFLHGGMGGKERYVVPIIPLLFYYGYLSLVALGGWLAPRRAPHGASRRGARLGRVLLVVLAVALTARALYERRRQRGGALVFSERWQRVNARDLRQWRQAVQWVKELGPPDCTIYPGPGGMWATLHYLSEQRVGKLHYRWRGLRILKSMVQWDAAMVLMQRHGATYEGVLAAMQEHPDCFERLRENGLAILYRIHQPRLRQLVERLEAAQPTASP